MKRSDEKLMNQIRDLKTTLQSLESQARECETAEKAEKLKAKKAMEKGNMDGARIYAGNSIRKHNEHLDYTRLASRLDAVVSRLDSQAKMMTINKYVTSIFKAFNRSRAALNLQKMSETVYQFKTQFVNMEAQFQFVENAIFGSTSLSTPEDQVNTLMQQVADDNALKVSVGLPQAPGHAIPTKLQKVEEDDLSRRLAKLKSRG